MRAHGKRLDGPDSKDDGRTVRSTVRLTRATR
jgi:hypothetical protein